MPSSTQPHARCSKCGTPLKAKDLDGLCPACLWGNLIPGDSKEGELPAIPGHEILEQIGHGGMGLVYRARQESPAREVALKIVAPYSLRAAEAKARFLMEIEAMAAVEHPSVLPLYEVGEDDAGRPWLTMQLMQGGTLADRSSSYSGKWREAAGLIKTLGLAIAFAHERGIIHRDLKPSNILFDSQGHPHIADFGLAKWADSDGTVTQSSYLLGSPSYLAPEAATKGSKATTTVSDVYGLGAIFYELLTGAKPYDGDSAAEIITQIINQPPQPPRRLTSKLPRDLEVIVLKAMSREPAKRYHSAKALADDIDRWLEGRPILARPASPLERTIGWVRRNPALSAVSFLLLASLITAGILQWRANRELTIALKDSENLVDYMTRELPDQLEPIGRLEVLDGVFENVSEHFEDNPRTDPETLARHADFLGRWAQILRPRGRIVESVERLRQSHQKALAATEDEENPSLNLVRSRLLAGLHLGEALHEEGGIDEARRVLEDTADYAKRFVSEYPEDLKIKISLAKLTMEFVISNLERDEPEEARADLEKARKQWAEIRELLLLDSSDDENKTILADASRFHYFEAQIHRKTEDSDARMVALKKFQIQADELKQQFPDNTHLRSESVVARTKLAAGYLDTGIGDPEKMRALLEEVDREGQALAAGDPGNLRWATDSLYTAVRLAMLAKSQDDDEGFTKWHQRIGERMLPLYQTRTTDLRFLRAQLDAAGYAFEGRLAKNWTLDLPHYLGSMRLQREFTAAYLKPDSILEFNRLIEHVTWHVMESQSPEVSVTLLQDLLEKIAKNPGTTDQERNLWSWLRSATYRGLAYYQKDPREEEASLARSYELLLSSTPAIPLLFENHHLRSDRRLNLVRELLTAGAFGAPRENDEQWTNLILNLTPQLNEEEQLKISEHLKSLLPTTDPRYLALQILIKP